MKKIILLITLQMSLFVMITNVEAVQWKETIWHAKVSSLNGELVSAIWNVGDNIKISVRYDIDSALYHDYYDGPNGIAEHGSGDDILAYALPTKSDDYFSGIYDATFTFDHNINYLINTIADKDNYNRAWMEFYGPSMPGYRPDLAEQIEYQADGLEFILNKRGGTYFIIKDGENSVNLSEIRTITHPSTPVPEPSTFLLLGVGIAGLGIWKRKKFTFRNRESKERSRL